MLTENKRHYALLFALPALLVILVFKIIPMINGFIIAFKDYSITKGIIGSPWVGSANFVKLFENAGFRRVIMNTIAVNLNFIIPVIILSFVLGLSLSCIKSFKLCAVFCLVFIIPFFIPQIYWNMLLFKLFSSTGVVKSFAAESKLYLTNTYAVRFMYVAVETIRWAGLFASIIAFAARNTVSSGKTAAALKAAFSLTLISSVFLFVTDFEMLHPLVNPLVYERMDTLTLYQYRTGLMNMDFGLSSSQWVLQFLFCFLILILLLVFANKFIINSLLPFERRELSGNTFGSTASNPGAIVIPVIYTVFLAGVFGIMIYAFTDIGEIFSNPLFISSCVKYTILALISAIIGTILSILLAYPIATSSDVARKIYMVVFLILIAARQLGIHDYLQFRSWELIDTYFAIILSNMFYPVNVIILGTYYNQKTGNRPADFTEYIRECFPAIICVFIGTLLLNMDSYTSSLLYMNRPDGQSPSALVYRFITGPR